MPRKPAPQNLSDLVNAVDKPAPYATFEDLPDFISPQAMRPEPPVTAERADIEEHPRTSGELPSPDGSPAKQNERNFTFKSRVLITDGYQYQGSYTGAPDWVSRDWLQYDSSPPKGYQNGPALYLPDGQICRISDWIVKEEADGKARTVVYSDENMQHFFSVRPA